MATTPITFDDFLHKTGFVDFVHDGEVSWNEVMSYNSGWTAATQEKQKDSFDRLAGISGDRSKIEEIDFQTLFRDPSKLADLIQGEKATRTLDKCTVSQLKAGERTLFGNTNADNVNGISYTRYVFYLQLGLKILLPSESIQMDGSYGKSTTQAVQRFEEMLPGIDDDGKNMDRYTVFSLLFYLRHKTQMRTELTALIGRLEANKKFIREHTQSQTQNFEAPQKTPVSADPKVMNRCYAIMVALQYLGYINGIVEPSAETTPRLTRDIPPILEEHYGHSIITTDLLDRLIDDLRKLKDAIG